MKELERTFLPKNLPDLTNCKSIKVVDVYFPFSVEHPVLRLRKNGNTFEMTKKTIDGKDKNLRIEQTITLTKEEYDAFANTHGKKVHKIRYFYPYKENTLEISVFQEKLKEGFVLVDVEFDSIEEKDSFVKPNFCCEEVTQVGFFASGLSCGKSYEDIKDKLEKFGYVKQ